MGKLGVAALHRMLIVLLPLVVFCAYVTRPVQPVVHTEVTPTAEIVSAPSTIGIADSSLYGMSQQNIDTTLDMLQAMGVENVRVYIPWIYTEPLPGQYNWAPIDDIMDAAKARNMGVLAMVNSTPVWAGTAGNFPGAKTPDPTAYANFMTQVATRYGKTISAYEVWNEVNCNCFYDPVSPSSYTQLLQAAYPAIKAVDPTATVIAAGLGSVFSAGGITMNPVDYVAQMYAAGAKNFFDAMAFHPYQETLKFSDGQGQLLTPYTQIQAIHDLMVAFGDGTKTIWITEYGVPTDHVSEQTQADYIKDLINTWQTMTFGGPIFIYTTRDDQPGSGKFGIFDVNWVPKEAAFVIAQEILRLTGVGGVEGIVARVFAAVRLAIGAVVNVAVDIGKAVVKVVDAAWNAFVDVTKAVTKAVVNTVKWIANAVVQGVKWVANTAVDVTKAVVAGISNVIQKIGDIIRPPASSAAVPPTAALKAVSTMKEAAAELDSPKPTASVKHETTSGAAAPTAAKGKETATEPETTPVDVKSGDQQNPAASTPEVKTPDAKDATKPESEGKKPAEHKDSSAPAKDQSAKDQPAAGAPKGEKGTTSGQHKGGDGKATNSAASGDTPKSKSPKPKSTPKSKSKPVQTAAATGDSRSGSKPDQN